MKIATVIRHQKVQLKNGNRHSSPERKHILEVKWWVKIVTVIRPQKVQLKTSTVIRHQREKSYIGGNLVGVNRHRQSSPKSTA